jgi:hypothetical protein
MSVPAGNTIAKKEEKKARAKEKKRRKRRVKRKDILTQEDDVKESETKKEREPKKKRKGKEKGRETAEKEQGCTREFSTNVPMKLWNQEIVSDFLRSLGLKRISEVFLFQLNVLPENSSFSLQIFRDFGVDGFTLSLLDESDHCLLLVLPEERQILLAAIREYKRCEFEEMRKRRVCQRVEEWARENQEEEKGELEKKEDCNESEEDGQMRGEQER